jgi:hypothetical protein
VTQHLVVDREAVVELAQQLVGALELEQVVVRLRPMVDLVGEPAHSPLDVALQIAVAAGDLLPELVDDRAATVVRRIGVDQDYQVICRIGCQGDG